MDSTPFDDRFVVMKFGGSSVSGLEQWRTILTLATSRLESAQRPILVLSAMRRVTDLLADLADRCPRPSEIVVDPALIEIRRLHEELAAALGLTVDEVLDGEFEALAGVLADARPPTPPSLRAEILAFGERMSTRLGAAFLSARGVATQWIDARELLDSSPTRRTPVADWLSAECATDPDPDLQARLRRADGVVVTQGFVARNPAGRTVVLGRGGSDTAAAYLAARIGATRLEIWSDVPGMFTTDPRVVPGARLLRALDYREAQEIATTGSRVLHPRCLPAVREKGIPVHLKSTLQPDREGTVIRLGRSSGTPRIKAITSRTGVTLISMETLGMWQEVGFLSRATTVFADEGLSLDLVSTSETNITVSLDGDGNLLDEVVLRRLLTRLNEFCRAHPIPGCAAVSLVGTRIRELLHELGPVLEAVGEHRVHLMTQAASDLNLTVVVDESSVGRLVRRLHEIVIPTREASEVFGDRWDSGSGPEPDTPDSGGGPKPPTDSAAPPVGAWWAERRSELLSLGATHAAAWVYHLDTVRARARALRSMKAIDRVFFAMKANWHPALLEAVIEEGIGIECVSPGELAQVESVAPGLSTDRILYTPNFSGRDDYQVGLDRGVHVTIDALYPLENWGPLFQGRDIILRLDTGWGSGHNERVVTGGHSSKFGIALDDLPTARDLVERAGGRVVGLHAHLGSGIRQPDHWAAVAHVLVECRTLFPHLRLINVGGGLGVPEMGGDPVLDLASVDASLSTFAALHDDLELWMEPGRFLVSEAGVLLARVTQVKEKSDVRFVGVAAGMNALIRPALYGARHHVVNLSRVDEPAVGIAQVVGPICESGDRLATDRSLPACVEGDVMLIANAGAYGRVMSSEYNLRPILPEFVL